MSATELSWNYYIKLKQLLDKSVSRFTLWVFFSLGKLIRKWGIEMTLWRTKILQFFIAWSWSFGKVLWKSHPNLTKKKIKVFKDIWSISNPSKMLDFFKYFVVFYYTGTNFMVLRKQHTLVMTECAFVSSLLWQREFLFWWSHGYTSIKLLLLRFGRC